MSPDDTGLPAPSRPTTILPSLRAVGRAPSDVVAGVADPDTLHPDTWHRVRYGAG